VNWLNTRGVLVDVLTEILSSENSQPGWFTRLGFTNRHAAVRLRDLRTSRTLKLQGQSLWSRYSWAPEGCYRYICTTDIIISMPRQTEENHSNSDSIWNMNHGASNSRQVEYLSVDLSFGLVTGPHTSKHYLILEIAVDTSWIFILRNNRIGGCSELIIRTQKQAPYITLTSWALRYGPCELFPVWWT
jgi:hypothetical protein